MVSVDTKEIHFDHMIYGTDKEVTDADIEFILDAYIAAVEERGLWTGGGCVPCEGEQCRHCIGS